MMKSKSESVISISVIVFISTVIFLGILVVHFTAPEKLKIQCQYEFQSFPEQSNDLDSQPQSIVIADLNHDQHPDFIVIYSNKNTLAIYLGHQNNPIFHFIGQQTQPVSLAVAHLNNDEHFDVVVANARINSINVFFGFGNGSLTMTPINYSTGKSRPRQVLVADINNDNQSDILVLGDGTNEILLFMNVNDGLFSYWKSYETGFDSFPCFMNVADVNRDNQLDLIVANNGTDDLTIFFAIGHCSDMMDQRILQLGMGADACHFVIDDIDHDSIQDLIVTKTGSRQIGIFRGHGNGTFKNELILLKTQQKPYAVGVTDFNKDNRKDLLIIYSDVNRLEMLLGQETGSFISQATYSSGSSSRPSSFALSDINQDDRMDVVLTYTDTNSIATFLGFNQVKFGLQKTLRILRSEMPAFIFVMDFNGDHYSDLMVWHNGTTLVVFLNDGSGQLNEPTFHRLQSMISYNYFAMDMNNDNRMDMLVCGTNCTQINVYLQLEDETFAPALVSSIDYNSAYETKLYLFDINDDMIPDLLFISSWLPHMTIFLGYENGTFHHEAILMNIPMTDLHDVGDINHDGRMDIVFIMGTNGLFLLFGTDNGSFINEKNQTLTRPSYFRTIILKDMNNDQYIDYVVFDDSIDTIIVALNDGRGTIDTEHVFQVKQRSCTKQFFVDDFNGDLNMDVSLVCVDSGSSYIYLGRGDGTLISEVTHTLNMTISSWAFADFNHDQRLDWIVLSSERIILSLGYDPGALNDPIMYLAGSASRPSMILTNDFNHDQQLDLVLVNTGQHSIAVRLGQSDGTFNDGTTYSLGDHSSPSTIAIGDFNRDQLTDLVVVNTGIDSITVLTGLMNGSFVLKSSFSTGSGSRPSSIVAADLNDDGWIDLAVSNSQLSQLSLFFGYEYSRVIKQDSYQSGTFIGTNHPLLADFNNDQHMDLATTDIHGVTIGIFFNDGTGKFVDQLLFPITTDHVFNSVLFAGSIDDNDQTDLVVKIYPLATLKIFYNLNQSSWSEIITYEFNPDEIWNSLFVDDMNHDRFSDLIIKNYDEIRIYLSLGNKTFTSPKTFVVMNGCQYGDMSAGYFNEDRSVDLLFIDIYQQNLCFYFGHGDGIFTFSTIRSQHFDDYPTPILWKDLNYDGLSDLIVTYASSSRIEVFLFNQNDSIKFTYSNPFDGVVSQIDTGDFNQDGYVDLVMIVKMNSYILIIAHGSGDGTFSHEIVHSIGDNHNGYTIIVGDLNHDGTSDIIIGINGTNTIVPYLLFCCDSFTNASILPNQLNTTTNFIVKADFNRDNRIDLIVSYANTNKLGLFLNLGNETFDGQFVFSMRPQSRPMFIAIADFNHDDFLDLVILSDNEELIDIYLGQSIDPTFHFNQSYSIGISSRPRSVSIVDLNNDTHLDIIVSNDGTDSVGILLGNGDGSFRMDWHLYTGYATDPSAMIVGDFHHDGQLDVIVVLTKTNTIGMIEKQCEH